MATYPATGDLCPLCLTSNTTFGIVRGAVLHLEACTAFENVAQKVQEEQRWSLLKQGSTGSACDEGTDGVV